MSVIAGQGTAEALRRLAEDVSRLSSSKSPEGWPFKCAPFALSFHLNGAAERLERRLASDTTWEARQIDRLSRQLTHANKALARSNLGPLEDGIDPNGYFVYYLWRPGSNTPAYVGQSRNVLARLGQHVYNHGQSIARVTVVRCQTQAEMIRFEAAEIRRLQPIWNRAGK